ncbi:MAG: extracellular solute-binding protein [Candidatus Enteromonas sp.]|nr:extracellular solute-binding protein [Candidatus Enteromonas sp.]
MKNKFASSFFLGFAALLSAASLSGCSEVEDVLTLRLLNCEDYIGEDEFEFTDENGKEYTFDDVLSGFEEYESERLGKTVRIVYDTYDTNETMLSSLKTGKSTYDLIVASDYTIQKMMNLEMLQKIDFAKVPNYVDYVSPYLNAQLEGLTAVVEGKEETVKDYSIGYMWGTLGILYNPSKIARDKRMDEEEVKFAMNDWNSLWNPAFYGEMSVKDSMRDTYSIGIMKEFDQEIKSLMEQSGYFDDNFTLLEGKWEEAIENYSPLLGEIFNRCDEANVEKVKATLLDLKENIFGFEVDSGKEDMVKGLIGINLAWSGDAVFALDTAEEGHNPQTLYYSIPKTGGNIWFDGWMMTRECAGENQVVAYDFLNFLSDPQIAVANMNYIGYTSFIAGDDIHSLVGEWYDCRQYDYSEEVDEEGNPVEVEVFEDGTGLRYGGTSYSWDEFAEENGWSVVDLTYMFEGTLSDDLLSGYPSPLGNTPMTNPYLFYTDELEDIHDGECIAGRQFYTQYPPQNLIPKLAIMKDYGDNNKFVLAMWQDVKSNNLPLAGVIVFGAILVVAAVGIITSVIAKRRFHKLRVERRKAAKGAR